MRLLWLLFACLLVCFLCKFCSQLALLPNIDFSEAVLEITYSVVKDRNFFSGLSAETSTLDSSPRAQVFKAHKPSESIPVSTRLRTRKLPLYCWKSACQWPSNKNRSFARQGRALPLRTPDGGEGARTPDLRLAKPALFQTELHPQSLVGLGRLELPTSRLSGVRSSQLSYRPSSSFAAK